MLVHGAKKFATSIVAIGIMFSLARRVLNCRAWHGNCGEQEIRSTKDSLGCFLQHSPESAHRRKGSVLSRWFHLCSQFELCVVASKSGAGPAIRVKCGHHLIGCIALYLMPALGTSLFVWSIWVRNLDFNWLQYSIKRRLCCCLQTLASLGSCLAWPRTFTLCWARGTQKKIKTSLR